jgi:hypothetical protein
MFLPSRKHDPIPFLDVRKCIHRMEACGRKILAGWKGCYSTISPLNISILEGANYKWKWGNESSLVFTCFGGVWQLPSLAYIP